VRSGKLVPARYWDGSRWVDDYLHARTFETEDEAQQFIREAFREE
jgi:hypothetical protein